MEWKSICSCHRRPVRIVSIFVLVLLWSTIFFPVRRMVSLSSMRLSSVPLIFIVINFCVPNEPCFRPLSALFDGFSPFLFVRLWAIILDGIASKFTSCSHLIMVDDENENNFSHNEGQNAVIELFVCIGQNLFGTNRSLGIFLVERRITIFLHVWVRSMMMTKMNLNESSHNRIIDRRRRSECKR